MSRRVTPTQFQDKLGRVWPLYRKEWYGILDWSADPHRTNGVFHASVAAPDKRSRHPTLAQLLEFFVHPKLRNHGIGQAMLDVVIKRCKQLGHAGIFGNLSSVDSDHFDMLQHIYEKFGFTFTVYTPDHPEYNKSWLGRVDLQF